MTALYCAHVKLRGRAHALQTLLPALSIFVKVAPIMQLSRIFFPLLLAFALLFAQQGGASHALRHALEKQSQHDKQTSHFISCEQCATYAQLGSALSSAIHSFALFATDEGRSQQGSSTFRSIQILAAVARGPPAPLQAIA